MDKKQLRVAILISGEGTNLQAIIDDERRDRSPPFRVVLVVSNKKEAFGLKRAQEAGIPCAIISVQDFPEREAFDRALIQKLEEFRTDLVVLAGFMRVLGKNFVEQFRGRVINIHPALLPAFPGTGAIEKAWSSGIKTTGVTVHFVDEGVDTGPVILQKSMPIEEGEDLEGLTKKIHQMEHRLYPQAIRLYAEGRIVLEGQKVMIKGAS